MPLLFYIIYLFYRRSILSLFKLSLNNFAAFFRSCSSLRFSAIKLKLLFTTSLALKLLRLLFMCLMLSLIFSSPICSILEQRALYYNYTWLAVICQYIFLIVQLFQPLWLYECESYNYKLL